MFPYRPGVVKPIAEGFKVNVNFPNYAGSLDGKHIRIIKPQDGRCMFYNYKHFFSIVLLCMCDTNYLFPLADDGAYGKESDSETFKTSALLHVRKNNKLNFPVQHLSVNLTLNL